jgi:hypothetical protein
LTPRDRTLGAPNGTWQYFGWVANVAAADAIGKGNPYGIDAMRYGRCDLVLTEGDLGNGYATFLGAANWDNTATRRLGLLIPLNGAYYQQGLFQMGTAGTVVDFRDANRAIFVANTEKVSSNFNKFEVRNASSRVDWTSISITALGTVARGNFEVVNNADVNFLQCVFTDMGTFAFLSASTIDASTFRRCDQVTAGGAAFSDTLFDSSRATSAVSATTLNIFDNCSFVSDGTGHAVNLGTISSSTSMNWNCNDSGYAGTNGSTGNETILVNVAASQTLTINVGSGYTIPTYYNTGAGTVSVVSGQVTTTITVLDITDSSPLQNARVYLVAGAGGPLSEGDEIINTLTDSNGEVSDIRSLAADQPVTGWVRKANRGSLRVDSDTDVIQRTANLPSTTAVTMMGYAQRVSNRSSSTLPQILVKLQDATNANSYSLTWAGLDGLQLWKRTANVSNQTNFTYEPAIGEWFAFAITASGTGAGQHKGFVWPLDTLTVEEQSTTGISFTPSYMTYGTHPTAATNWADVRLANIRVWDAALTQAELEAELFKPAPVRTANLNTAWVDDGIDISGNGRNWTITDTSFAQLSPFPVAPFFKTSPITASIDNAAGLSLTIQMIRDE